MTIRVRSLLLAALLWAAAALAAMQTPLSVVQSRETAMVTIRAATISREGLRVINVEKTGAGIIIDPAGYIVTNTHIIWGSNLIKAVTLDGANMLAQVAFVSREYDFSILKVEPAAPLTAVPWGDSDRASLGQDVITIGHSPLLNRTISGGVINGLGTVTLDDGTVTPELIQVSMNHYPGDSGGPVFNTDGELLGLMNAKRMGRLNAALAVPSNRIHSAYLNLVNPPQKQ